MILCFYEIQLQNWLQLVNTFFFIHVSTFLLMIPRALVKQTLNSQKSIPLHVLRRYKTALNTPN